MKKLLLVLLVVALASFLLVGCFAVPNGTEGEGEGEGEGEVVVTIADSVVLDGKTYVSAGSHDITVTFPAPVSGAVTAYVGFCSGDYSKGLLEDLLAAGGISAVLFPNEDRTVWTGSADFLGWGLLEEPSGCCASYVFVSAGECEDETCIQFPVIVDACPPYALIEWEVDDCACEGCAVTFTNVTLEPDCADAVECCGDDCSGLASWSFTIYEDDPFDTCCDPSVCEEPIDSGSGLCPVDFTTLCLVGDVDGEDYWVVVELVDNVGLETTYYALVVVYDGPATDDCAIEVFEGYEGEVDCVDWNILSSDTIGACESDCDF